jgi:hypothetical protein
MPNLGPPHGKEKRKKGRHESGALGPKGLQDVVCCFGSHVAHVAPWPFISSSPLYYMLHYNIFFKCPNNVGVQVKEVCIFFNLFFHREVGHLSYQHFSANWQQ